MSAFGCVDRCDSDVTYGGPCTIHQVLPQNERDGTPLRYPSCGLECAADLGGSLLLSNSSTMFGAVWSHTELEGLPLWGHFMLLTVSSVPCFKMSLWCSQSPTACLIDKDLLKWKEVQCDWLQKWFLPKQILCQFL